ncbi:TPA: hypothetical protein JBA93_13045 [Legionella pneumophila subsp. pneumophila]|nr:hypothetical protein [Legionella pneumophila subsp. pneumophila]
MAEMATEALGDIGLEEFFEAYAECRQNKRQTMNALQFEVNYEQALIALWQDINERTYRPGRSIAFVIDKPVKREIFAADFRDRIVHHLIIRKLSPLFERAFIYDSYACRKGRGARLGIQRADRFIRQCSRQYTQDCYVLRLDIQGFFMAIDKRILWTRLYHFIGQRYFSPDKPLLLWLCHRVLANNPTKNCFIKGGRQKWVGFPTDKSLFHAKPHCGLPIGNLTSQTFANFYLNPLDHFIKHDLGVRFYGRYVDDFILVHTDKEHLKQLIPVIKTFLATELKLTLHPKKIYLQHYSKGIQFLGVVIKPHRITSGRRTKGNFYEAIAKHNTVAKDHKPTKEEQVAFLCSMNSYLGIMKHYNTCGFRKKMLIKHLSVWWWNIMYFSGGCAKLVAKQRTAR